MGKIDISKEELVGDEYRKQYLEHYILMKYKDEIKRNKLGMCEFFYSYLTFSINGLQNQTLSFREILKLRYSKYENATLRQKQMITYLYELACDEFKTEAQKIQNANEAHIIDVITFDETLDACNTEYRACLNLKYDLLQTISHDYINLRELEKQAYILQSKRQVLQNELNKLFYLNSSSSSLQSICEGFEECLIIEPVFTKKFGQLRKTGFSHINRIPLYIENSASVYITMLTDLGKIVKVSKNFKDVVPLVESNAEAIGKNINFMQPIEIASVHEKILLSSLEKKDLNQKLKHYPVVVGRNSKGWSIAYTIKIQLCMIGNTDLGACGWLKQLNDGYMYLMTSALADGFKVSILDQTFYSSLFEGIFSYPEAKKVQLINIIPMLQTLVERAQPGQIYETIVIQPTSMQDTLQKRDVYDDKLINTLMKSKIFQMKFSFYSIQNPIISFTIFQVTSFKALTDNYIKKEALRNFKIQIYQYMDLHKVKQNYADCLTSQNFSVEASKDIIGMESTKNILLPNNLVPSIDNIKNIELMHPSLNIDNFELQGVPDKSQIKEEEGEEQQELEQTQQQKLGTLRLIAEASNENSVNGFGPTLASRREYKQNGSLELVDLQVVKEETYPSKNKSLQAEFGIINKSNTTLNNLIGQETQFTLQTHSQRSKLILGNQQYSDTLNPQNTTDTHNILSSDSLFLSPISSARKQLLQADTNRQLQSRGEQSQINLPIIENSFEEDVASKNVPQSLSQYKSSYAKPSRKKNVSIQKNIEIIRAQKQDLNLSHSHSQNTSKNIDKRTQDEQKGKQEEREGSVKTGKTQRSTIKQD